MKDHEYTCETIFHFNCGDCSNWWSYAGVINNNPYRPLIMICPHCGYRSKIKVKEGFKEING